MADSLYKLVELRIVDKTIDDANPDVWCYICMTDPTDFLPIGGWRGAKVPDGVTSMAFLDEAVARQTYLTGWERIAPDEVNREMQARHEALQELVQDQAMIIAKFMMNHQGATQ